MSRRRSVMLVTASGVLGAVVLLAVAGPWLADPPASVGRPYSPPGQGHLLGLDHLGRDVLSGLVRGGRPLVVLPVVATALTALAGIGTGLALGYARGRAARLVERALDVGLAFPPLLVLLVLLHGWGGSAVVLVTGVVLIGTPWVTRLVRAATARTITSSYVELALAAGESGPMILWRDVLPTAVVTVTADAGLRLIGAIYLLATVGFLGFGTTDSWATMIADNVEGGGLNPWAVVVPALAIGALTLSVNVVADELARRRLP